MMVGPVSTLRLANPARDDDRADISPAERSGKAIIGLLQQAADAAQRNEERAKALAQQLAEELRAAHRRVAELEAQLRDFQARASNAEEWLMHIHDQIREKLIDPLTGQALPRAGR
jgi:folate-binding Fe-S cluster repair protein YgfZ